MPGWAPLPVEGIAPALGIWVWRRRWRKLIASRRAWKVLMLRRAIVGGSLILLIVTTVLFFASYQHNAMLRFKRSWGDLRHDGEAGAMVDANRGVLYGGGYRVMYPIAKKEMDEREAQLSIYGSIEFHWTGVENGFFHAGALRLRHTQHGFGWQFDDDVSSRPDEPTESTRESWLRQSTIDCKAPMWSLLVLETVVPIIAAQKWWRGRSKRIHGLCLRCGYDMARHEIGARSADTSLTRIGQ